VPEGVVDRLEVVEVDQQQFHPAAAAQVAGDRLVHPVAEQRPVGQPGERVLERLAGQLTLQGFLRAHVTDGQHDRADVRVVQPVAAGDVHVDPPAVGVPAARVDPVGVAGLGGAQVGHPGGHGEQVVGVGHLHQVVRGEPGCVPAQDPPRRGAGEDYPAVRDGQDGIRAVLEHGLTAALGGGPVRVLLAAVVRGQHTQPQDDGQDHGQRRHEGRVRLCRGEGQQDVAGLGVQTEPEQRHRPEHRGGGHDEHHGPARVDRQSVAVESVEHVQAGQAGRVPGDEPAGRAGTVHDPGPRQRARREQPGHGQREREETPPVLRRPGHLDPDRTHEGERGDDPQVEPDLPRPVLRHGGVRSGPMLHAPHVGRPGPVRRQIADLFLRPAGRRDPLRDAAASWASP
jgi:hypothetical protein